MRAQRIGRRLFVRSSMLAVLIALSGGVYAQVPVLPGQGITFKQVNFTDPLNPISQSRYGMVSVDFGQVAGAVSASSGYLNIRTSQGWVIQNLPVNNTWDSGGLSSYFDLGSSGTQSSVMASASFSLNPVETFAGGAFDNFNPPTAVDYETGGLGGPALGALAAPLVAQAINFNKLFPTQLIFQPGHVALEEDKEQCGPGAVARSLTYLENRYGVPIPHDNNPGIGDNNTPNSLVAELDKTFNRAQGASFGYNQLINGKLNYIGNNNLTSMIALSHHNTDPARSGIAAGNYTSTGGVLSMDGSSQNTQTWLLEKLAQGADVEIVFGNRHVVTAIGGGTILGAPYVLLRHDQKQGVAGGTSLLDGGIQFSWLHDKDNNGLLDLANFPGFANTDINFMTSETTAPEPGSAWLATLGLALLARRYKRRVG
jgi:MYXO-CTERM domain-containing protein